MTDIVKPALSHRHDYPLLSRGTLPGKQKSGEDIGRERFSDEGKRVIPVSREKQLGRCTKMRLFQRIKRYCSNFSFE